MWRGGFRGGIILFYYFEILLLPPHQTNVLFTGGIVYNLVGRLLAMLEFNFQDNPNLLLITSVYPIM